MIALILQWESLFSLEVKYDMLGGSLTVSILGNEFEKEQDLCTGSSFWSATFLTPAPPPPDLA